MDILPNLKSIPFKNSVLAYSFATAASNGPIA
jgi:hypothetical protein